MSKFLYKILPLSLLFCTYVSYSQNHILDIDTVTVVSNRIPKKIHETGRNIFVIESDRINQLPVNSIDELLRYLPGAEVQSRGSFGVQSDIILRGSTFSQVLVLLDGIRLNDPLTAHFNNNIPISLSEIERIEIIYGPVSSIYGADAMGGVINIISKTFSTAVMEDQAHSDLAVKFGEFDYTGTRGGLFYKKKKIKAGFGIITNQARGQLLPSGIYNYFNVKTASGSVSFPLSDRLQLMLRSGYDNRNFNAQYFYTRSPFDLSEEKITGVWNQARLSYIGEKSKSWLDAGYKYNEDWFLFNPAFPPANEHTTQHLNMQVNHVRSLSRIIDINAGLQAGQKQIESNDRGNHTSNYAAAFTQLNIKPVDPLNIGASLRIEYDEIFGTELLPQLSSSYVFNRILLRAAAGRSIRSADFTERFISNNLKGPLPQGRNIGNPDLRAESASSYEAGIEYFPWQGMKFSATAFSRNGTDIIDYIITPYVEIPNNDNLTSGATYFYPKNIADVTTNGLQLEVTITNFISERHKQNFIFGYTFIDVETGEVVQGAKYLTSQAKHLLTANYIHTHRLFNLSLNGLWKKRAEEEAPVIKSNLINEYLVINSRLDINLFQSKLFFTTEVLNLLNTQYSDILGAKMPDRWIILGIQYRNNFNL